MNKLKNWLDSWCDGKNVRGIKKPPLATLKELLNIAYGTQRTTINGTVVEILERCKIKTEVEGIGWRIDL